MKVIGKANDLGKQNGFLTQPRVDGLWHSAKPKQNNRSKNRKVNAARQKAIQREIASNSRTNADSTIGDKDFLEFISNEKQASQLQKQIIGSLLGKSKAGNALAKDLFDAKCHKRPKIEAMNVDSGIKATHADNTSEIQQSSFSDMVSQARIDSVRSIYQPESPQIAQEEDQATKDTAVSLAH